MATKMTKEKRYAISAFNLYIRWRDADSFVWVTCCSCGKRVPLDRSDAGHFVSCDREPTRFDEQNVHGQCRQCNRFASGRAAEHGVFIEKKYGEGTCDAIRERSRGNGKRSDEDHANIKKEYRAKLKALFRERGLE